MVVRIEMSGVRKAHHGEPGYEKDLLCEQALRVLLRGLSAQMDPELAAAPNIKR